MDLKIIPNFDWNHGLQKQNIHLQPTVHNISFSSNSNSMTKGGIARFIKQFRQLIKPSSGTQRVNYSREQVLKDLEGKEEGAFILTSNRTFDNFSIKALYSLLNNPSKQEVPLGIVVKKPFEHVETIFSDSSRRKESFRHGIKPHEVLKYLDAGIRDVLFVIGNSHMHELVFDGTPRELDEAVKILKSIPESKGTIDEFYDEYGIYTGSNGTQELFNEAVDLINRANIKGLTLREIEKPYLAPEFIVKTFPNKQGSVDKPNICLLG